MYCVGLHKYEDPELSRLLAQRLRLSLLSSRLGPFEVGEDPLEALVRALESELSRQQNNVKAQAKHSEVEGGGYEPDEQFFLDELRFEGYCLGVVGLYRRIEITMKQAITATYGAEFDSKYDIKKIETFLKTKGISSERLIGHGCMNEIRVFNNCIKHSGTVSPELARIVAGLTAKHTLQMADVKAAFVRLLPDSTTLVRNLIGELMKTIETRLKETEDALDSVPSRKDS